MAELQNLVINWKLDELEIDVDSISRNEDNNQNIVQVKMLIQYK